jgi:MinD superfamily P-loop ATPase
MSIHQVAVMSGKGGAGKTSFTAALLKLFPEVVAVDADVNASNLPILLGPEQLSKADYFGMDVAEIDRQSCSGCGKCVEICAFEAIDHDGEKHFTVNDECEGCAACSWVCPQKAISLFPHCSGRKYVSKIENGFMVHADLVPGEDNSGKLIASIREDARALAEEKQLTSIVIDGPPGTSCQAISSLTGVQLVLAILEESLSGLSDYKRLAQLLEKFRLPHLVVVNKGGLNAELGARVDAAVIEHGGKIIARIPFDPEIPQSLARRETLLDMPEYRPVVEEVFRQIQA